ISDHSQLADQLGVKIINHCNPDYSNFKLDHYNLKKIINNLLSNAVKYTLEDGTVTVTCDYINDNIQVKIIDTGVGISRDDQEKVFDRYFQTSDPEKIVLGGTGIGLALVSELVNLLHGEILLTSAVGKGSTFTVNVPAEKINNTISSNTDTLVVENIEVSENELFSEILINSTFNHTIMVVEDNHDLREFLVEGLNVQYTVVQCSDGKDAWESLTSDLPTPSLILSDVMMPRMNGLQLLKAVKSIPELRKIPFLLLTAKSGHEHKIDALRIGVDDYMSKPFDTDELHLRISNLLSFYIQREPQIFNDNCDSHNEVNSIKKDSWLLILENVCRTNINNPLLSVDFLADQMQLGRTNFYKRLKYETGLTPNKYLKEVRLQVARDLLTNQDSISVKDTAFQIGILDVNYFSKMYKARFGKNPSDV
ncbi:MAG: ATP-binding protein, partial [Saprospiraceae bacterium]